jgi:hypothetical protein
VGTTDTSIDKAARQIGWRTAFAAGQAFLHALFAKTGHGAFGTGSFDPLAQGIGKAFDRLHARRVDVGAHVILD